MVSLPDLKQRIIAAICALHRYDHELLEIDANERSITHKLAEHLQHQFPAWHVDCEYNRIGHVTKRLNLNGQSRPDETEATTVFPDIIVHQRLTNENLLVVEVKKAGGQQETHDIEKLKTFTRPDCQYKYGLFVRLGANGDCEIKLYQDGACSQDWTDDLPRALRELGYGDQ